MLKQPIRELLDISKWMSKGMLEMAKLKCGNGSCMRDAVCELVFGELAEQYRVPWCAHCICPSNWLGVPYHHAEAYDHASSEVKESIRKHPYQVEKEKHLKDIEMSSKEALSAAFKIPEGEPTTVEEHNTKALYNRQPHYEGGIDPITYGKDNFTPEEMNGFYKMNVVKYVSRCDRKNGLEDLKKAQDYLNLLIDSYSEAYAKEMLEIEPVEDDERELTDEEWREHERKKRVAAYKKAAGCNIDEELENLYSVADERALKEAELCVQRFHNHLSVQIKRQDVLDIVQDKLKGEDYTMLCCGDGTTFIEKNERA